MAQSTIKQGAWEGKIVMIREGTPIVPQSACMAYARGIWQRTGAVSDGKGALWMPVGVHGGAL